MGEISSPEYTKSRNIFRNSIVIDTELFYCRVYWAKVISSETESLFTQYTKHTFFEMQYALNGRIGMLVGENEQIDVEENYFIIVPPDTYHQIIDGDSIGARFIIAFSLDARDRTVSEAINRLSDIKAIHQSTSMRSLLSMMINSKRCEDAVSKRILDSLTEMFILEIIKAVSGDINSESPLAQSVGKNEKLAKDVVTYIASRAGIGVSAESVAEKFNYSARHLNRIMICEVGKTLHDIISHEKLKKIEEYAASTILTLYEIAALCGFSDAYAMNRFFRRYNKINLSQYRRISGRKNGNNM